MIAVLFATALAGQTTSKATIPYPKAGSGDVECRADLVVDPSGQAKHVLVSECPADFARSCEVAMSKWRWEPDPTPFVEQRQVRFSQSSPWARVSKPLPVEGAVTELIKDVHHSELHPAERIAPRFPSDASGHSGTCIATVLVPVAGGAPTGISVEDCDDLFYRAVRMALLQWDFAPTQEPGAARWLRSRIPLRFDEPADPQPLDPSQYASRLKRTSAPKGTVPMGGKKLLPQTCTAQLTVTKRGTTSNIEVSDCDPLYHISTENAVQRWTYEHLGEPEEIRVVETLEFLRKRDEKRD